MPKGMFAMSFWLGWMARGVQESHVHGALSLMPCTEDAHTCNSWLIEQSTPSSVRQYDCVDAGGGGVDGSRQTMCMLIVWYEGGVLYLDPYHVCAMHACNLHVYSSHRHIHSPHRHLATLYTALVCSVLAILLPCAEELASLKMDFHLCVKCRKKILQDSTAETDIGWVEDGVVQV